MGSTLRTILLSDRKIFCLCVPLTTNGTNLTAGEKFGEFTLKSGRKSPFFMNAGAYVTGSQLKRLGEYYAKAIHDNYGLDFLKCAPVAFSALHTV